VQKPVGLVYVGARPVKKEHRSWERNFPGDRKRIPLVCDSTSARR